MIIDLKRIRKAHEKLLKDHDRMVKEAGELAAEHALQHVAKHARFKHRTGRTRDTTRAKFRRTKSGGIVRVSNATKVARFLESGTRPHVIQARRKKALSFMSGGRRIARRRVNHPGTRPYKFLWRATHASHRVMGRFFVTEMGQIAKRF